MPPSLLKCRGAFAALVPTVILMQRYDDRELETNHATTTGIRSGLRIINSPLYEALCISHHVTYVCKPRRTNTSFGMLYARPTSDGQARRWRVVYDHLLAHGPGTRRKALSFIMDT